MQNALFLKVLVRFRIASKTATMGKPKRSAVLAAAQESMTPPDELTDSQSVARVVKAEGNSLYTCELPNKKTIIVELEPKFRNTIFIRRGGYVLVDLASADERPASSRVVGEIINIVRDEKEWRKQPYWYEPCAVPRLLSLTDIEQAEEVREAHVRRLGGRGLDHWQDAAQRLGGRGGALNKLIPNKIVIDHRCAATLFDASLFGSHFSRAPHHTSATVAPRTPTTTPELAGVLGYTFHAHSWAAQRAY